MRIYTVCLKNYDSLASLHGPLYEARRSFWESGRKYKKSGEDFADGIASRYSAAVAPNKFEWQKISGRSLLEKSYVQDGSFCVLKWDVQGRLVSKTSYTRRHNWIQTSYFIQTSDPLGQPSILLRPCVEGEGIECLTYDSNEKKYRREELLPCPVELGTAENSVVNSIAGEPRLYASTDEGDFCYCTAAELPKRKQALRDIEKEKEGSSEDKWIPRELETKFETNPELTAEEEQDLAQDGSSLMQEKFRVDGFSTLKHSDVSDDSELHQIWNWEEEPCTAHQDPASLSLKKDTSAQPDSSTDSYPLDREVFRVDTAVYGDCSEENDGNNSHKIDTEKLEEKPSCYVVAAKNSEGMVTGLENLAGYKPQPQPPASDASVLQTPALQENSRKEEIPAPEAEPALEGVLPAKSIVVSAQESYLYFGNLIDGMRQGRGRTQMASGQTAYEGDYVNDKRSGFGAYYYNTGRICYVGGWKENKRDGVGVSFRPQDNSIFVGRWKEDQPVGTASVFDRNGNLMYAGKFENGERQGVGVSYNAEDGAVFVGKWKDNIPTGEGSAFDCDGNLLYTGSWKDGRRHGMGTEYSSSGATVFIGLWEDNRRVRGILYQNGIPTPYPPESEEPFSKESSQGHA